MKILAENINPIEAIKAFKCLAYDKKLYKDPKYANVLSIVEE
jgi:hypothetical protein